MARATITQTYALAIDDGDEFIAKLKLPDVLAWEAEHRKEWLSDGAPTLAGQAFATWKAATRLGHFSGTLEEFLERVTTLDLVLDDETGKPPAGVFPTSPAP